MPRHAYHLFNHNIDRQDTSVIPIPSVNIFSSVACHSPLRFISSFFVTGLELEAASWSMSK